MKKWEYKIVDCSQSTKGTSFKEHTLKSMQVLNQLGGEGWRVLSTNWKFGVVLMEREVLDPSSPRENEVFDAGFLGEENPKPVEGGESGPSRAASNNQILR